MRSRFDVESVDGTSIAVWVEGNGPPIVLVHGTLCDHTRFDPLVAQLRDDMTTFAMDRRGFGASGDGSEYAIDLEFGDVAAVVRAVGARTGRPVALLGHSYGAGCAMGAATMTSELSHLVLYEPGLGLTYPPGSVDRVEQALAVGDREAAIRLVFVGILEMTEEEYEALQASPTWPVRVAAAPTVPRECRAEESWVYRKGQFDSITAPTLMLTGDQTPTAVAETTARAVAAMPDVKVRVLPGHGHLAMHTHPETVAPIIREFLVG